MNLDQLFHAGEWLDRFTRTEEAVEYYQEALRRDPEDSRVNTEMGFLSLKRGEWKEALGFLDRALERDGNNARIHYGKGLARLGLQEYEAAYRHFYRATYGLEVASAAFLQLARLEMRQGRYREALDQLNRAESYNRRLADLPALRSAAHRLLGNHRKARQATERALALDPLHFMAGRERKLAVENEETNSSSWEAEWRAYMRDAAQNYLELSVSYATAGLFQDALEVLDEFAGRQANVPPMVDYYRGYYSHLLGQSETARRFFETARRQPVTYTHPHRLEAVTALETALQVFPEDAHAHLLLGNLLYARGRRAEGLKHWEKAVALDSGLFHAWRNLGYGKFHVESDFEAAHRAYREAVKQNPQDAVALLELDQVAEKRGLEPETRLAFLLRHPETLFQRDDLLARSIELRLQVGGREHLEEAFRLLQSHHFHIWEGKYGIHQAWVEVNQKLGDLAFEAGNLRQALTYYQHATAYPSNLEVAPRTPDFRAHVFWNLARTYQALGDTEQAGRFVEGILAEQYTQPHLGTYFQALAEKLRGNEPAYRRLLSRVEERGRELTSGKFQYRGQKEIIGHYLLYLVLKEQGRISQARMHLQAALEKNPLAARLAVREAQLDVASAHQ